MSDPSESVTQAAAWIADLLPVRDKIVSAITQTADELSGASRRKLHRLADEIAFGKTVSDVLSNPIALEICLAITARSPVAGPLEHDRMNASTHAADISDADIDTRIETAVNSVLYSHLPVYVGGQRLWTLLVYPFTVLLICYLVLAGVSWLLVPMFEQMFDEFGLSLPGITVLLFGVADAVRSPMTYVGGLLFLACIALFAWLRWGNGWGRGSRVASWNLRGRFRSTRGIWADWAWHVSLLLRAGIEKSESIRIASASSGRAWLQSGGEVWSQEVRVGGRPFHGVTHFRGVSCHLLSDALGLDDDIRQSSGSASDRVATEQTIEAYQAGLLRDVAEIYWDRDRQGFTWRMSWLPPLMVCGIGLMVMFAVMALFAPLVELITGLT